MRQWVYHSYVAEFEGEGKQSDISGLWRMRKAMLNHSKLLSWFLYTHEYDLRGLWLKSITLFTLRASSLLDRRISPQHTASFITRFFLPWRFPSSRCPHLLRRSWACVLFYQVSLYLEGSLYRSELAWAKGYLWRIRLIPWWPPI